MELLAALVVTFLILLFCWIIRYGFTRPDVFSAYGVPVAQPVHPFVGNLWGMWKIRGGQLDIRRHQKYGKIWGEYQGRDPVFVIADCDLLRDILVKDFDVFPNHDLTLFAGMMANEPVARNLLFLLENEKWKAIRSHLTPAFTSGKLKKMIPLVDECSTELVKYFHDLSQETGGTISHFKSKISAHQLGVIAISAFGIKISALHEPNNPFVLHAKRFNVDNFTSPLALLFSLFPWLAKITAKFTPKVFKYFIDIVTSILSERKGLQTTRGDMLDILAEASKKNQGITEDIIIANSVVFLLAGGDTTVNGLSWLFYELTLYPEIQEKIYEEVKDQLEKHGGEITSDMVAECKYLEQAILETLRMHSPAIRGDRRAARNYDLQGIKIPAGTVVEFTIHAIHHDPEHYPDPEKFDPDRFSRENKSQRHPMAFLAFGAGPRNCIGMRLALEIIMVTAIRLLLAFRFVKGDAKKYPAVESAGLVNGFPADFAMDIERRSGAT